MSIEEFNKRFIQDYYTYVLSVNFKGEYIKNLECEFVNRTSNPVSDNGILKVYTIHFCNNLKTIKRYINQGRLLEKVEISIDLKNLNRLRKIRPGKLKVIYETIDEARLLAGLKRLY